MSELPATSARAALEMARGAGFALDPLCDGLAFDARSIGAVRRITWDDYCTLVERIEIAAGGPEKCEELLASSYHAAAPREVQAVFGAFVSPRLLYRFIIRVVDRQIFPGVDLGCADLGGGSIRITFAVQPPLRPCLAWSRGSVGALRGIPGYLGLPMAEVEVEALTDRSLVALVRPPPSRTLAARARRASGAAFRQAALKMFELFSRESSDRDAVGSGEDLRDRVEELRRSLSLTPRQAEVVERVVRGRSNKEIAAELGCAENTIEFHLTQLLRKAGVDSRTLLIAKFWAGALPLH